jgi:hypothetical protein
VKNSYKRFRTHTPDVPVTVSVTSGKQVLQAALGEPRLEFRAEAYNVLDHENFQSPTLTIAQLPGVTTASTYAAFWNFAIR